jgi:tetrahydromethanopterin S-methyltransferase subunit G
MSDDLPSLKGADSGLIYAAFVGLLFLIIYKFLTRKKDFDL